MQNFLIIATFIVAMIVFATCGAAVIVVMIVEWLADRKELANDRR